MGYIEEIDGEGVVGIVNGVVDRGRGEEAAPLTFYGLVSQEQYSLI